MKDFLKFLAESNQKMKAELADKQAFINSRIQEYQTSYNRQRNALPGDLANNIARELNPDYHPIEHGTAHVLLDSRRQQSFAKLFGYMQSVFGSVGSDPYGDSAADREMDAYVKLSLPHDLDELAKAQTYETIYTKANAPEATTEDKQNLSKFWMEQMSSMLAEHGDFFRNPPRHSGSFADEFSEKRLHASILMLDGVNALKTYAKDGIPGYTQEQIDACINGLSALSGNIKASLQRLSRIADPLYDIIDFQQVKNCPTEKVHNFVYRTAGDASSNVGDRSAITGQVSMPSLLEKFGLKSGENGYTDAVEALYGYGHEVAETYQAQKQSVKDSLLAHFGKVSMAELTETFTLVDSTGKALDLDAAAAGEAIREKKSGNGVPFSNEDVAKRIEESFIDTVTEALAAGKPLFFINKDGSSDPIPVCGTPHSTLGTLRYGDEVAAMPPQEIPAVQEMTLLERLLSWLYDVFTIDPNKHTDRQTTYNNEVKARDDAITGNELRQNAVSNPPKKVMEVKNSSIYKSRADLLKNLPMEKDSMVTYETIAGLLFVASSEWKEGVHRSLVNEMENCRNLEKGDPVVRFMEGRAGLVFREMLDDNLLNNNAWKAQLQSGDPARIREAINALVKVAETNGYFPANRDTAREPSNEYVDKQHDEYVKELGHNAAQPVNEGQQPETEVQPNTAELAKEGRARMEEKVQAEQQVKLDRMLMTLVENSWYKASSIDFSNQVHSIIENGTEAQKDMLLHYDDDDLKSLSGLFENSSDKDLGKILDQIKAMADEGPAVQQGNPTVQQSNPEVQQGGLGGFNG